MKTIIKGPAHAVSRGQLEEEILSLEKDTDTETNHTFRQGEGKQ